MRGTLLTLCVFAVRWEHVRVWRKVYPENNENFIQQKGSNCKPKPTLTRLESMHAIKKKLLELADRAYRSF